MTAPAYQAPNKVCPHCQAQAQTLDAKCPHCGKKYKKKNRIFLKVFLGVVVSIIVLAVGCTALIGSAAKHVSDQLNADQKAHAITTAQFDAMKTGESKAAVLKAAAPATPQNAQEFQQKGVLDSKDIKSSCIYFNKSGGKFGDIYQLCFTDDKLDSKNNY